MPDGPFDDAAGSSQATYDGDAKPRVGFFTDTTLCIGCKACEVACKQWNDIPADGMTFTGESYDNTGTLGGDTWRHVAFVEQIGRAADAPNVQYDRTERWLMESDVCKHCTSAACLDVCPTGALFRTEFGTVVVQDEICNGCGYCVPACPFGVIDTRAHGGHVGKCTMCYDRLKSGEQPACSKACPTESIQFGELDELRERAAKRLAAVSTDFAGANLYGADPDDGVGGFGAFFLLLDKPELYGMPPDPLVTTRDLKKMYAHAAYAALALGALVFATSYGGRA